MRRTRNPLWLQGHRGFKSHPLRLKVFFQGEARKEGSERHIRGFPAVYEARRVYRIVN